MPSVGCGSTSIRLSHLSYTATSHVLLLLLPFKHPDRMSGMFNGGLQCWQERRVHLMLLICLQAQGLGRSAWYNATIDGKVLAQNGKWLIPLDLQQWPKALPSRGVLELDVLQLPMNKAPWIRADQIYIHSRKDSEVLALQQLQSEDAESSIVQALARPTSSHYQIGSAGHFTAGVETMEQVANAAVNSSASVAIQPDLT